MDLKLLSLNTGFFRVRVCHVPFHLFPASAVMLPGRCMNTAVEATVYMCVCVVGGG